MNYRRISIALVILVFVISCANIYAQSPREPLQTAVAAYRKNASRENVLKVIEIYKQLEPPPAVPEEAREPFVMANTMVKKSSDATVAAKAVELFTKALAISPWWADAYFNRAIARETAGQFSEAIDDLKLYLEFKLTDAERREAQDKIYSLKAELELKNAAAEKAEKAAATEKSIPDRLSGNWTNWIDDAEARCDEGRLGDYRITYKGQGSYEMQMISFCGKHLRPGHHPTSFMFTLNGSAIQGMFTSDGTSAGDETRTACRTFSSNLTGSLSPDGNSIELKWTLRLQPKGENCIVVSEERKFKRL